MQNLTEFEKARKEGFIGEDDIYIRQLTRKQAVVIEQVGTFWVSYRVHWRDDGKTHKTVDLSEEAPFDKALDQAIKYIKWFASRWDRYRSKEE